MYTIVVAFAKRNTGYATRGSVRSSVNELVSDLKLVLCNHE